MNRGIFAQREPRRAFTLIELVMVLAISGLLLVVVVPRIGALYDRQLLEQQARLLEEELLWLRGETQVRGIVTSLQLDGDDGYRLQVQRRVEQRDLVSSRMRIEASSRAGRIAFSPPRSTAFEKCTLTLHLGEQTRTVAVSDLGRVRVGVAT